MTATNSTRGSKGHCGMANTGIDGVGLGGVLWLT